MKTLMFGAACALAALCVPAHAVTLDFVAEASGNERGITSGTTLNFGGLGVTFTSNFSPYFDDVSGGPGGLGVCQVLTGSQQCTPNDDDNITTGENVTLAFDETVDLSDFSFNDADHNSLQTSLGTLLVGLNGAAPSQTTFAGVVGSSFLAIDSITFAFGGDSPDQFYLAGATATPVNAVPLPAAMPLFLGALAMLGFVRRRRSA